MGQPVVLVWVVVGLLAGAGLDLLVRALIATRHDLALHSCSACQRPSLDIRLVPLIGGLLRAPCSSCARRNLPRLIGLQLGVATAFAALAIRLPFGFTLVVYSFYALVLALIFVVDLEHRLIFNAVTYPAMLVSLLFGSVLYGPQLFDGLQRSFLGGLVAGGLFLLMYLLACFLYKRDDALGLGDVKLALLIGLMVGWPDAMAAILLGTVVGGIIATVMIVQKRSGRATMPYGTALTVGTLVSLLVRTPIG